MERTPLLEELQRIDISVIEQLTAVKETRGLLEERLGRLEAERSEISEAVYQRIRNDYEAQRTELTDEITPLADQAREQYAELNALFEKARDLSQATELDREEIQVRNRLGELDEKELEQRLGTVEKVLEQRQRDLARITEVKEKLVSAFDSEDDLLPATRPPAPEPAEPTAPDEELAAPAAQEAAAAPELPTEVSVPEEEATPAAETEEPATPWEKTFRLPAARLAPIEGGSDAEDYLLGPLTSIGRVEENQIQVDDPAVSRYHAEIVLDEAGFLLRDLGSQNGTFANEEPVQERVLQDGDLLQIGSARFVFRSTDQ